MEYKACPIRYTTPFAGVDQRHHPASFSLMGLEPIAEYHTPEVQQGNLFDKTFEAPKPYYKISVVDLVSELEMMKPLAFEPIAYWRQTAREDSFLEFIYRP